MLYWVKYISSEFMEVNDIDWLAPTFFIIITVYILKATPF